MHELLIASHMQKSSAPPFAAQARAESRVPHAAFFVFMSPKTRCSKVLGTSHLAGSNL
jgi:hypothetical protein